MNDVNRKTFSITMDYLRDIVAKQTFRDSPAAALRELIQNAHDACLVDSALTGSTDYAVHIVLDPVEKTISIEDNGIGMTVEDVHDYLTTVGRGKKGTAIAEKYGVSARNAGRLENVIGEFGFGFVAAFIIADRIELWTRAARKDEQTTHYVFSTDDVAYTWETSGESIPTGTRLLLHLNQSTLSRNLKPTDNPLEGNILSWDTVDAIVRKFCIFLEFPIYVTMRGEKPQAQSNVGDPPWRESTRLKESADRFFADRVGKGRLGEFLHVVAVDLSRRRGDAVDVQGVLVVEDAPSVDEAPANIEVFVKRMWVCDRQQSLMPAWAYFLRGLLVTPDLRPMPGRDSLDDHHDSWERVRTALCRLVYESLLELARGNPRTFNRIVDRYGPMMRWGLVREKQIADERKQPFHEAELIRYMRFVRYGKRFMQGNICTLNEYLNVGPLTPLTFKPKRVVYLVGRPVPPDRQLEFRRLIASHALDVIVPDDESELALLASISDVFDDIITKNVELELLKEYAGLLAGDERARWLTFVKYFQELSNDHHMSGADVGALEPDYMPALILNIPGGDLGGDGARADKSDDDELPKSRPLMVPNVPPQIAAAYNQTLVINSRNRTMKNLLEYKEKTGLEEVDAVLGLCLHQCYHMALQAAVGNFASDMLRHMIDVECKVIQDYVERQTAAFGVAAAEQAKREELDALREEAASYRRRFGELSGGDGPVCVVPATPTERRTVVVFCDLMDSTSSLVSMDFDERGTVLQLFVDAAQTEVRKWGGVFDKFTGDGLIAYFGIDEEDPDQPLHDACDNAWVFAQHMHADMASFNADPRIREIKAKRDMLVGNLDLRIAMDAGRVSFGRFGGSGTAIGIPLVIASRLCANKELFKSSEERTLVTGGFVDNSSQATSYESVGRFRPAGIPRDVTVYKRRSSAG